MNAFKAINAMASEFNSNMVTPEFVQNLLYPFMEVYGIMLVQQAYSMWDPENKFDVNKPSSRTLDACVKTLVASAADFNAGALRNPKRFKALLDKFYAETEASDETRVAGYEMFNFRADKRKVEDSMRRKVLAKTRSTAMSMHNSAMADAMRSAMATVN